MDSISAPLFNEILQYLQSTESDTPQNPKRARIALQLFNRLVTLSNLASSNKLRKVAATVFQIAQRSNQETTFLKNSLALVTNLRVPVAYPEDHKEALVALGKEIAV